MSRKNASEEVKVLEKHERSLVDTSSGKNGKRDAEKKKKVPPSLKIDEVDVPGEVF